jgi:hypothetical protein
VNPESAEQMETPGEAPIEAPLPPSVFLLAIDVEQMETDGSHE